MVTTLTDYVICPTCGRNNDRHTGERRPEAGDFSVCYGCGGIHVFTGPDGNSRKPTPEELAELRADAEAMARLGNVIAAIQAGTPPSQI